MNDYIASFLFYIPKDEEKIKKKMLNQDKNTPRNIFHEFFIVRVSTLRTKKKEKKTRRGKNDIV